MVQVILVIHESYVIFSLKRTMTIFAAVSFVQGQKQCEWFSKKKFFEPRSFETIYSHRGREWFPLPQEPLLLPEVHSTVAESDAGH